MVALQGFAGGMEDIVHYAWLLEDFVQHGGSSPFGIPATMKGSSPIICSTLLSHIFSDDIRARAGEVSGTGPFWIYWRRIFHAPEE